MLTIVYFDQRLNVFCFVQNPSTEWHWLFWSIQSLWHTDVLFLVSVKHLSPLSGCMGWFY